jgi:hypothetical protein
MVPFLKEARMLRKFVVLGVVALLPTMVMAQPEQGDWELTLQGGGFSDRDWNTHAFSAGVGVGYFLSREAEVGVRQGLAWTRVPSTRDQFGNRIRGTNSFDGVTRGFFDWHFDLDQFQPFIGVTAGYRYGDGTRDSWVAGLEGGLKYYLHRNTFIYGMAEYQWLLRGRARDGGWVYSLGLGTNW